MNLLHLSKVTTVLVAPNNRLISSLILLTLMVTLIVSSVFARPYADNQVYFWTVLCGLIMVIFTLLSFMKFGKKRLSRTVSMALATLTPLLISLGLTGATLVYVPGQWETVVVPKGNHALSYALTPGKAQIVLPWQADIYTSQNMGWRWIRFQTADKHFVTVTIENTGQLVSLFRQWDTPDKFFQHWDQLCHQELDPVIAAIHGDEAFRSLESRCAAFTPVEEMLSNMTKGQDVSLRLGV